MTAELWMLTALLSFLAVAAWAALIYVFPALELSHRRYRLWQVRDGIVDSLLSGELDESEAIDELLEFVDGAIKLGKELNIINDGLLERLGIPPAYRCRPAPSARLDFKLTHYRSTRREPRMCFVSNIGTAWGRTYREMYPWVQPYIAPNAPPPVVGEQVSRKEFEALRHEMQELRKLLIAAKAFDAATGQPDCEMDEKVALIRRIGELVGVDFGDVLAGGDTGLRRKE